MNSAERALAEQSLGAFLWSVSGAVGRTLLQFAAQIVLARILGPTEYGIFALGVIVVMLSIYFADIGLAYGLIQKQDISEDDIRFVWTWQWILGVTASCALFSGAEAIAHGFGKPEAQFVFRWLALVVLVNALAALPTALLKKALDYRSLQIAQLTSYCVGYIVIGIPLALSGFGAGALVAAWLAQTLVNFFMLYAKVRHSLALRLWIDDGARMLGYGAIVLSTNLINWACSTIDKVFIGRLFPVNVVGLYTTAFNFVNAPAAAVYVSLQSVVFSACARLQNDAGALRAVFLGLLCAVTLIAFPLFAVLGVGADVVMVAVFGRRWADASQFLGVFAFVMPFLIVWGISTPIIWNAGRASLEFKLQVPILLAWLALLYALVDASAFAIAVATACFFAVRCVSMVIVVARVIGLRLVEVLIAVRGGVLLTALIALMAHFALVAALRTTDNPQLQLLLLLAGAGCGYLIVVGALAPKLIDRKLHGYLAALSDRLPRWTMPVMRVLLRPKVLQ